MKIIEMNKLWVKNKLKEIVHNNLVHGIMSFLPRHISEKYMIKMQNGLLVKKVPIKHLK